MRPVLNATGGAAPPTAPVGRRALAALVDLGVIAGGEIVALIVGGTLTAATGVTSTDLIGSHVGVATALARALTQTVAFVGPGVYLYVSWSRGASVGMRAVQCRLRSFDGVSPATSSQVLLRMCGLWFSLVSAGIGLLVGLVRADRRGLSDLFARTRVVHLPPVWAPAPAWGGASAWGAWPGTAAQPPPVWTAPPPAPPPPSPPPAAPPPLTAPPPSSAVERTPWTWSDVLPVVVLLLPLSLGVEYVTVAALKWPLRGVALSTRRPIEAVSSDITAYGAVFLLVLLFVRVRRHATLASLGVRRVEWRWLLAALPFTFAAFLFESITGLLSQSLFPQAPSNQCVSIRDAYQGALPLAVVGVAMIAPLVEEIVFRGMVFGWLRGRTPIAWAVVISAALFSLEHVGFLQLTLFLPIFAAGLVLATLYHHARSLWPSMLVHGTFNLVATLVLFNSATC
ncbi:MAG TPA: CPBP family glutamic-type intramembrane protease [Candidatus Dormibacteraeota bacterium]|nr:CPBP family glutamic-type intramembrane protease [Candidatus Dormibacteraeota bacterium]